MPLWSAQATPPGDTLLVNSSQMKRTSWDLIPILDPGFIQWLVGMGIWRFSLFPQLGIVLKGHPTPEPPVKIDWALCCNCFAVQLFSLPNRASFTHLQVLIPRVFPCILSSVTEPAFQGTNLLVSGEVQETLIQGFEAGSPADGPSVSCWWPTALTWIPLEDLPSADWHEVRLAQD